MRGDEERRRGRKIGSHGRLRAGVGPGRHPVVVLDPFGEAEERYHRLVESRKRDRVDPRVFRAAVRELAVRDAENREWMIGPEDGLWYRRDRDQWIPAEPPRRLVCSSCGHHNLVRHSFCVECGGRLQRAS